MDGKLSYEEFLEMVKDTDLNEKLYIDVFNRNEHAAAAAAASNAGNGGAGAGAGAGGPL